MGGGGGEDEDSYSYADLGGLGGHSFRGVLVVAFSFLFLVALGAWLFVCLLLERVVAVVIFQLYLGVTGRVANVGLIVVASGSVAE